jgi:hypothetical protein
MTAYFFKKKKKIILFAIREISRPKYKTHSIKDVKSLRSINGVITFGWTEKEN